MTGRKPAAAFEGFDLLVADIDPTAPTFFRDSSTVAAYLIGEDGAGSARSLLTTAIMAEAIASASAARAPSLLDVHRVLREAEFLTRQIIDGDSEGVARRASKRSARAASNRRTAT